MSTPIKLAGITQSVEVQGDAIPLQNDTIALGRVLDAPMIQALPLAARNFTQIVDLSPGVLTGVNNAGELGLGGSDLQASSNASGGVPIPNPDAIQEFKVQTGLYNVSFGGHAGASVSLVLRH